VFRAPKLKNNFKTNIARYFVTGNTILPQKKMPIPLAVNIK